jgi:hypothetical protein
MLGLVRKLAAMALSAAMLGVTPAVAIPPKPKLLLVIAVDQFRYDFLIRFRDGYTGGIARLLKDGAVFADARYPQFPTVTATGHATILTGATPSVSGIVGNNWFEREPFIATKVSCPLASPPVSESSSRNKSVESISDDSTCLVGGASSRNGASPRRLLVSTLGDELKMAGRASKVIGVSFKNRSAILPSGHMADAAYWFEGMNFVTNAVPYWVMAFNGSGRFASFQDIDWLPAGAQSNAQPLCSMKGARETPGGRIRGCEGFETTPFANSLLEDFAESAIENEKLGTHDATDILTVSFSANDLLGHRVGPDAPEIREISIRTDEAIGKLLDFADRTLGKGATLTVFTADHGVAPAPAVNNARKMPGGWIDPGDVHKVIKAALSDKFGPAEWLLPDYNGVYLNYESEPAKKAGATEIVRVAAEAASKIPHIARVITKDALENGAAPADAAGRAVALGFYAGRSPDLVLLPDPYFMFGGKTPGAFQGATTHATPYSYDDHVPLIVMGGGIKPGAYYEPVLINDVAPTLAAILEVETPSGSSGRILREIFE